MIEELDDLTLVYMYGAKNGRDSMKEEIERLRAEIARKDAALWRIADDANYGSDGTWSADSYPDEIARAALAQEKTDA
jgi:hypothetical protein